MLTIPGPKSRYCDGLSRRSWLQIGGLALGGLSLPEILRAEAQSDAQAVAGSKRPIKGIIMVLLPGGPSHLDMYDLKPDAPSEIRGELRPIATNVPGIDICELMPQLAGMTDKLSLIRSLVGFRNDHNTHWCSTGWESHPEMPASPIIAGFPPGGWPSMGAVLSKQFGTRVPGVPPCVDLSSIEPDARFILRTPPGQAGYLGAAHAGFEAQAVDRRNIMLNGVDLRRLSDRRSLLNGFDRFRQQVDQQQAANGGDEFRQQAFDVLTSPRLAEALDLSREERECRGRYGLERKYPNEREGKTHLDQFLLARRVIEAGARCVTLAFSRWPFGRMLQGDYNWDWHKDCFAEARGALPLFDLGLSALIQDLDERGLLDDIAVVAWGEFGRTPKINGNAGRDHWPNVAGALLAGGGMRCGQVIGSTTRWGEEAKTRPVHFRDVFATLYQRLGIDVARTQFSDLAGRPQYLVGEHRPLPELIA
ncbi:MAG: DUF1501 domain-containing protein [Planctomycetes bacterium]|nr:DUF1501 domain-containing protein [Planctomycetota bacterium]MBL7044749.1 DUF1501 domain-containing protein [Pirellulaceae bacterium]